MGDSRGVYRVFVGKSESKRQVGRPRRKWEGNIRMGLQEKRCGCIDWIDLAQDRDRCQALVKEVMNIHIPKNAGKFLTSCKPVNFSRRNLLCGVSK